MRGPHNIWRLIRTGATFERTGAMQIILDKLDLPPLLKFIIRFIGKPFKVLGLKGNIHFPPIVRALTALGPAYIKFGQILSTRPDVVGAELAKQLSVLQESLPPFSRDLALLEIERDLEISIDNVFENISEPIAAASIAQIHKAVLKSNGQTVAIKVLRPGIEKAFRKDINAFYLAANIIELLSPKSRRLRPVEVIEHFDSVVQGELDLRLEASAASEFSANTKGDTHLCIPNIHWETSGRRVMTLDWVDGIPLADLKALKKSKIDMEELSTRILSMFLRHALRDGFFHGDMHQGNLKINAKGELAIFDFGIMGRIDEYTRRVYAEILMGFIKKDYKRVAEVHFEAGYISSDQDVDLFAQALRSVGEPIFGQNAENISMAKLLSHLFDVTERFGMETRTELILLQRTMVVVEGVSRSLNPTSLDIWEAARPEVENYIKNNLGPKALIKDLIKTAQILSHFGPKLPNLVENLLTSGVKNKTNHNKDNIKSKFTWALIGSASTTLIIIMLNHL
ncbi:2-polyprenylphenol 6-hydroxylase [Amylibacter sp.]|nr:2-polyprenylphenol 6-hydroxylase [Amylibacter sp.]